MRNRTNCIHADQASKSINIKSPAVSKVLRLASIFTALATFCTPSNATPVKSITNTGQFDIDIPMIYDIDWPGSASHEAVFTNSTTIPLNFEASITSFMQIREVEVSFDLTFNSYGDVYVAVPGSTSSNPRRPADRSMSTKVTQSIDVLGSTAETTTTGWTDLYFSSLPPLQREPYVVRNLFQENLSHKGSITILPNAPQPYVNPADGTIALNISTSIATVYPEGIFGSSIDNRYTLTGMNGGMKAKGSYIATYNVDILQFSQNESDRQRLLAQAGRSKSLADGLKNLSLAVDIVSLVKKGKDLQPGQLVETLEFIGLKNAIYAELLLKTTDPSQGMNALEDSLEIKSTVNSIEYLYDWYSSVNKPTPTETISTLINISRALMELDVTVRERIANDPPNTNFEVGSDFSTLFSGARSFLTQLHNDGNGIASPLSMYLEVIEDSAEMIDDYEKFQGALLAGDFGAANDRLKGSMLSLDKLSDKSISLSSAIGDLIRQQQELLDDTSSITSVEAESVLVFLKSALLEDAEISALLAIIHGEDDQAKDHSLTLLLTNLIANGVSPPSPIDVASIAFLDERVGYNLSFSAPVPEPRAYLIFLVGLAILMLKIKLSNRTKFNVSAINTMSLAS